MVKLIPRKTEGGGVGRANTMSIHPSRLESRSGGWA